MDQHKFERIDKGIKRHRTLKQIDHATAQHGALTHVDDEELIERIAAGAYVSHLARDHGVTHVALHLRLKSNPRYKLAMRCRNAAKLDEHQNGIETADQALTLARAREAFKAASWRAERECPDEWGQKQEVTHHGTVGPLINIQLSVAHDVGRLVGSDDEDATTPLSVADTVSAKP